MHIAGRTHPVAKIASLKSSCHSSGERVSPIGGRVDIQEARLDL